MTDKNIQLTSTISENNTLTLALKNIEMPKPNADEAPPIGKIRPFSKMAVTFEPLMGF